MRSTDFTDAEISYFAAEVFSSLEISPTADERGRGVLDRVIRDFLDNKATNRVWAFQMNSPAQAAMVERLAKAILDSRASAPASTPSVPSTVQQVEAQAVPNPIAGPFDALLRFCLGHPDLERWVGKVNLGELRRLAGRYKHKSVEWKRFAGLAASLLGILSRVPPGSSSLVLSPAEQREYNRLHAEVLKAVHLHGLDS